MLQHLFFVYESTVEWKRAPLGVLELALVVSAVVQAAMFDFLAFYWQWHSRSNIEKSLFARCISVEFNLCDVWVVRVDHV